MGIVPPDAGDRARKFGDLAEGPQGAKARGNLRELARSRTASPAGEHARPALPAASSAAASRLPASSASPPWLNSRWPSKPARASDGLPWIARRRAALLTQGLVRSAQPQGSRAT
jgi:hypothetical protein